MAENVKDSATLCEEKIIDHRKQAGRFYRLMLFVLLGFFFGLVMIQFPVIMAASDSAVKFSQSILGSGTMYFFYGIFILVFGVITSFYRFHIKEVSKYENYLFGFERMKVAKGLSQEKYMELIITSLTAEAFPTERRIKKVESPLPGHPTSDIGTALMNKILDQIEISASPKKSKEHE